MTEPRLVTAEDRAAHVEREAVAEVRLSDEEVCKLADFIAEQRDAYPRRADDMDSQELASNIADYLAALPQAGDAAAASEWGVMGPATATGWALGSVCGYWRNRADAERVLATRPGDRLVSRQRTTFPDVLTDWTTAGADQ